MRTIEKSSIAYDRKDFYESFSVLLLDKLTMLEGKSLNDSTCLMFYTTIFDALVNILATSSTLLSNEATNYIAQQFYDNIILQGGHRLNPNIFEKRAKLENISTEELRVIGLMFKTTDDVIPVLEELRRRK